jgi:hypothetical protein
MSFFRLFGILQTGSIHPEALYWAARVAANGGTVSNSTLKAVSDFCKETASIRDRFLRLNLFCGNNLNAALVPLYLGEAPGIVHGNSVDTNINFVAADYIERGINAGLVGNGTNKYLDTGFIPNSVAAMGLNDASISVYCKTDNSSGRDIGAIGSVTTHNIQLISKQSSLTIHGINNANLSNTISDARGHNLINRSSESSYIYYKSNINLFTINASSVSKPPVSIYVFTLNNNGSPFSYSNKRLAAYHLGRSLSPSQVAIFYNALQKFQTALNRQV